MRSGPGGIRTSSVGWANISCLSLINKRLRFGYQVLSRIRFGPEVVLWGRWRETRVGLRHAESYLEWNQVRNQGSGQGPLTGDPDGTPVCRALLRVPKQPKAKWEGLTGPLGRVSFRALVKRGFSLVKVSEWMNVLLGFPSIYRVPRRGGWLASLHGLDVLAIPQYYGIGWGWYLPRLIR